MKESKNLGVTKACPECRKVVIKSANFTGYGTFHTKCPHCKSLIQVEVKAKTSLTLSKVVIAIVIVLSFFFGFSVAKNTTLVQIPYAE